MSQPSPRPSWRPLLLGSLLLAASASAQADLDQLLDAARSQQFSPVSASEQQQAQLAFAPLLAGKLPDGWDALGLQAQLTREPDVLVLHEPDGQLRGRGFIAVRPQPAQALLLQAPHQYHDLDTGKLALQLFAQGQAQAAFWNTAHRYLTADSDLPHVEHSYLHALSLAFAQRHPQGLILQLHGFEARASRDGVQAIVSSGSRESSPQARRFTDCLRQRLDIDARLYPDDIEELGATRNTVASALRQQGFSGFLHLEMDRDLRRRLVREAGARSRLLACVREVLP